MAGYKRLGEILINEGMITPELLEEAIVLQAKEGLRLGEALVKLNYIEEGQIVTALSKQLSIPHVTLVSGKLKPAVDQDLKSLVPYEFSVRNLVLPLSRTMNSLTIALFDPLDLILLDNMKKLTGCQLNLVISTRSDILKAVEAFYGKEKAFQDAVEASYKEEIDDAMMPVEETQLSLDKLIAKTEEAPVIKLVDLLIRQAIEEGASDIHIEPQREKLSLRYRVDGVLYEISPPSRAMQLALISRIKILSKMNIAEKRLPQDGSFMVRMGDRIIDLRVSSVPIIYGEKIVLRILDKSRTALELEKLGFLPQELEPIKKGISVAYGLVFLTGPTGSGKSTTLYSALNELNTISKNILTIEDPVEYRMDGVNQTQVKPEIGLTFGNILRSFLRQDPDIILVGEVRDLETAEICVRAALTGHLVLSTLHTNNAASTVTRMVDMGIPSYLVASSLKLVVAQRLIRKLCSSCKEPYEIKKNEKLMEEVAINVPVVYRAKGCEKCNFVGFKGRSVIAETLLVDEDIREAVYRNLNSFDIISIAKKKGTLTLLESGLKRVESGITSLAEVLSVASY